MEPPNGPAGSATHPPAELAYPWGRTIHGVFDQVARQSPEHTALIWQDERISYRQLRAAAIRARLELADLGVSRGMVVPVVLPRSPTLAATLLGVLSLGAAYAALDPAWPEDRIARLVERTGDVVVAETPLDNPRMRSWTPPASLFHRTASESGAGLCETGVSGEDGACVLFTSGSSGEPKGVVSPHQGTVRLFAPGGCLADFGPDSVMPQAAPLPWDGLTFELWSVLLTGGTSVLLDEPYLTPATLRRIVTTYGVNIAWLTSSLFNLAVEEDLDALAGIPQLLTGGERLSPAHVRRFLQRFPDVKLINGYGPAECGIFATNHRIRPQDCGRPGGIPVGRAVARTTVHVLNGDRPCGAGEVGEICVAGDGLALGYFADPASTDRAFVELTVDGRPRRFYRSGDLGRYGADGCLEFVGRADRQVKVRGFRIELGEVEALIARSPEVNGCVVVPTVRAGTTEGLTAFVTKRAAAGEDSILAELRSRMPAHLVPDRLIGMSRIPLLANGKVDVGTLREKAQEVLPPVAATPSQDDPFAAAVRTAVGDVAGRGPVDDLLSLSDLGLSSLDLMRLSMRLEAAFGTLIPMSEVVRLGTVGELVGVVRDRSSGTPRRSIPSTPSAPVPLNPTQVGFLIMDRTAPDSRAAHCPLLWRLEGEVEVAALAHAVEDLARRHESLRARYGSHGEPVLEVVSELPAPFRDLGVQPDAASAQHAVVAAMWDPFRLEDGDSWRVVLCREEATRSVYLGASFHHIAFDGWSVPVFGRELSTAYNARLAGREPTFLRPAATAAQIFATYQAGIAATDRQRQREYWRRRLAGVPALALPRPTGGTPVPTPAIQRRSTLEPGQFAALGTFASARRTSLFAVLCAAYSLAIARLTGQRDFSIGVPTAARSGTAHTDAITCLLETLCLRFDVPGELTGLRAVGHTSTTLSEARAAQSVPFQQVVSDVRPLRDGRNPLFQVMLTLQNNETPQLSFAGTRSAMLPVTPLELIFEIETEVVPMVDGGAELIVGHHPSLVSDAFAEALDKTLRELLVTDPEGW